MEILGIGPLELLFILLIALIAVGPRDLGKAARSTGRMLNQLYKSDAWRNLSEASRSIRSLPNRLAREAALEELADVKREMEEGVTAGMNQFKKLGSDLPESKSPAPSPGSVQQDHASDVGPDVSEPSAQPAQDSGHSKATPLEDSESSPAQTDPSPEEN